MQGGGSASGWWRAGVPPNLSSLPLPADRSAGWDSNAEETHMRIGITGVMLALAAMCLSGCVEDNHPMIDGVDEGEGGEGGEGGMNVPEPACLPYADACPDGEYCQYEDGRLQCVPDGPVEPDFASVHSTPACPDGRCSRGGICMRHTSFAGGVLSCFFPCGPGVECPNGRHTCWPATGDDGEALGFGLCDY